MQHAAQRNPRHGKKCPGPAQVVAVKKLQLKNSQLEASFADVRTVVGPMLS